MSDTPKLLTDCPQCMGCGKLADTDGREPWSHWMSLPLESAAAVVMRLVRPIPCEKCRGIGKVFA